MSVILMYHALHDGDPAATIAPEDRPYAITRDAFAAQLDRVARRLESEPAAVRITFDDGHASNHDIALPLLLERGLQATFFITTGFSDQREHFCSAAQLRALAQAGMTIGGHGHTHAFLDDLSADGAQDELNRCRDSLSSMLGEPPRCLSFPGGRHDAVSERLARAAGFSELHGSRLGTADAQTVDGVLPRVAIRSGTDLPTFERMIRPDRRWYASLQRRQTAKHLVRRILGNRLYHGLYKSVTSR